jgi:hypothetical protein
VSLCATTGCEAVGRLRLFFHPEHAPPASKATAGLHVEVEPRQGISILLDGERVARSAPLHKTDITPGSHSLEVRATGYYPVRLPIHLKPGEMLRLPVALRPHATQEADATRTPTGGPSAHAFGAMPATAASAARQARSRAEVTLRLHVAPRPSARVSLDGEPAQGRVVTLRRAEGVLRSGGMTLTYRVVGADVLEIAVPDDHASWYVDGNPIQPGRTFRLHRGPTRIQRYPREGVPQTLTVRRL